MCIRDRFRWVALSGDPDDIYKTDAAVLEMFPDDKVLSNWINMAKDQVQFQGLPSRICWLGYNQRAKFGVRLNEMALRAERVLTNDPATGIIRHVDAGYDDAIENADQWDVDIPSL